MLSSGRWTRLTPILGGGGIVTRARSTILVAVILVTGVLTAPAASANVIPIEEIYEDTTLTEDHLGGIAIKEPNVTLDCDGFSIIENHVSEEGVGVLIEGLTGVSVKNCTVEGFDTGVHIAASSDIDVKNTISLSNVYGFFVGGFHPDFPWYESHHVTLMNNTASGATIFEGIGFLVEGGHDITLKNNLSTGNWDNGFRVRGPANGNLLVNNRAESNGSHGFEVHGYFDEGTGTAYEATDNVLRGNIAVGNGAIHGGGGFQIGAYTTMNTVMANHASKNRWSGFSLVEGANKNTLVKNHAFDNEAWGFLVYEHSTENNLVANLSMRNGVGSFLGEGSSGNVLESNLLCNNEEANLEYDDSSEPILIGNRICAGG